MKFWLLILGALLLVQLAHPLPVADSSSSEEENTPRELLLKEAFNLLFDLFTKSLKGVSQIFQNVIDKARHVENQSDELKKHLANFTEFINDVKDVTETDDNLVKVIGVIGLLEEMTTISNKYIIARYNDPEAFPEKLSLDQNGRIEFNKQTDADFEEFERKFRETLETYAAGLTPEAAKKDYRFVDWYNEYKNADDMPEKTKLLIQFLNIYD